MIPIYDANTTSRRPVLTIGLILANVLVFAYTLTLPDDLSLMGQQAFYCEFGVVPERITDEGGTSDTCVLLNREQPGPLTLASYQFLHGDFLHLAFNMLFLWVFGNNVEDRLGRLRYLPFLLACGAVAALAQVVAAPDSSVPLIGASGAIAGILGAYLVLFPKVRIWSLILVVPMPLPAWLWLVAYFVLQFALLGGLATAGDGVAYLAHIGGFVAGVLLIKPFMVGRDRRPPAAPKPGTAY